MGGAACNPARLFAMGLECFSCIAIRCAQLRANKALQGLLFRETVVGLTATTKLLDSGLAFLTSLSVRVRAVRVAERTEASVC
jgi:hypothetical protein